MDRWRNEVAIVTGASSGIGAAIVEKLVEAGLKVAGLARRKEKVEELAKKLQGKPGKLYPVQADVTKEEDILAAFKWVKENLGPVHILVNNAGIGRTTTLMDGETKLWKDVLETNVMGLSIATREAVKDMKANKVDGHIVHMNSVSGRKVLATTNIYAASKHAVTALTEALRLEFNSIGSKIKISSICPGMVATDIFETSVRESKAELPEEKRKYFEIAPFLQPSDIADGVMYVLSTPPHVQVHEVTIKPVGEGF